MPEEIVYCKNGDVSLFKTQKANKPNPEDIILEYFDGDMKKNALNFIEWLHENKLSARWQSYNKWTVKYKNKIICHFKFRPDENYWDICHSHFTRENWFAGYEKYITDDELKKFILYNIKVPGCVKSDGSKCNGISNITILGKHF